MGGGWQRATGEAEGRDRRWQRHSGWVRVEEVRLARRLRLVRAGGALAEDEQVVGEVAPPPPPLAAVAPL